MNIPTTDPWHVPPAPPTPLPQLIETFGPANGWATIAVKPRDVELGDVVDHTAGLMVVTEITRRRSTWTIGGYSAAQRPAMYWTIGAGAHPSAPPLLRHVREEPRVRVRRLTASWARLPGHTKSVSSHNPRRQGMFTVAAGWDASCSCGWTGAEPYPSRSAGEQATMAHRAKVLTDHTDRDLGNLAVIQRLEAQLGDVLPWRWDHGALAELRGLTTAQSLARLAPWAEALGVGIEHMHAGVVGDGEHFLWVDSRVEDRDPRLDIRAYPTDPIPEAARAAVGIDGPQSRGESVIVGCG